MKPEYARRTVTTAITMALLFTAACEGSATPAASPSPTADGTAAKPARVVLDEAREALAGARSIHVKGSVTFPDGDVSLDVRIGPKTAAGKMTTPVRDQMITAPIRFVGGRLYIHSRKIALVAGGPSAAAAIGDQWVYSTARSRLTPVLTTKGVADMLTKDGDHVSKGRTSRIDGIPVISLLWEDWVLYVAATGTPRPVRLTSSSDAREKRLDFSAYDVPFTVTAPPRAIDLSPPR